MAVIKGTIYSDWMYGTTKNDTIIGGAGLDHFYSSKGNDLFDGTDDRDNSYYDDTLTYGLSPAYGYPVKGVTVNLTTNIGTDGWGYTDRYINIYNVSGTQFNDKLYGNAGQNVLIGEQGDDYIDGRGGNDGTWYGLAPRGINVDLKSGKVTGGAGNDTLVSIEYITATNFADRIYGSDAKEEWFTLDAFGTSGTPNANVGTDDFLDGRGGVDGVQYYQYSTGVKVYLNKEYAIDGTGHRDTLRHIEHVTGSMGNDIIYGSDVANNLVGNNGDDTLSGGLGNDYISGGLGSDKLYGGDGNDNLHGDGGNNTLWGGNGNDVYVVGAGTDSIREISGQGTDTIEAYTTYNISKINNVERLYLQGEELISGTGNSLANVIKGNGAANKIWALGGNDRIYAGSGNDQLYGGDGKDRIYGEAGNDTLKGEAGNDTLSGGDGVDKLYGGAESDLFVFRAGETGATKATADTIYDFTAADHINLSAIDANMKKSGSQSFDFIGKQEFHGTAGELRYEKASSDTYIYADINGDKKVDFVIHLDDAVTLKADYFVL